MRTTALPLSSALVGALLAAGCGPTDECKRYVACQRAYDSGVDTSAYDSGGSCWTTLQTENACSAQCREATEAIAKIAGAPAVCSGGVVAAETDGGAG